MYFAGHKPLLALPWFCAIVFLFGDHMLAMTDLWVATFCTEIFCCFLEASFYENLIPFFVASTILIFIFTGMALLQIIATAALFLAAKSEETPRPLNDVLRASSELYHKQNITLLSYLLPIVRVSTTISVLQSANNSVKSNSMAV